MGTSAVFARAREMADPLEDCNGHWWFAETRPRWDDRLVRDVEKAGGKAFSVKETVIRTTEDSAGHRHRNREQRPLFPGYVFLNGTPDHRYAAASSLATLTVKEIGNQPLFIRQLSLLLKFASDGLLCQTQQIQPGSRIVVTRGALRGYEGEVDIVGTNMVRLEVTFMGYQRLVEVPPDFIEPI